MMKRPTVSVILPTRNNEDCIGSLLSSIFSQNFEGEIEVLVMDSSNDQTPQIVSKYSRIYNIRMVHVRPEDYNYGGTRNLGASMTSGDILVFISTDVEIRDRNWLRKLVRNLNDPGVAGVYGRQIPKENASPMEEFFIKYTYPPIRKEYYLKPGKKLKELFFSNTNSAIKRKVWEKIPLPEMLKSEDQEWAKRAILAGYKIVYDPEAAVYHSHRYTLKQVFKEYFDSGATMPIVYNCEEIEQESFLKKGLKYETAEIKYFISKGYTKIIPYALFYDFAKFLGYLLGTQCMRMPVWLRKMLCKKSNHWDRYDNVISEPKIFNRHKQEQIVQKVRSELEYNLTTRVRS